MWLLLMILLVLWLVGALSHVGGGLIHLLLLVALIVFIVDLMTNRRNS